MKPVVWLAALLAALSLTGCGLVGSDFEVEPSPLPEFKAELEVTRLWSTQVGEGLGEKYNLLTPLVQGERVFAADLNGRVYAFDKQSGARQWQVDLKVPASGGVGGGYGQVLLGTEKGEVVALSMQDGKELWRSSVSSEVVSAPQTNGELVLVQTIDGRLTALTADAGARRWTYSARQPNLTLRGTNTPVMTSQQSFAGFANGYLVSLDNATGELMWNRRVALGQGKTELERVVDLDGPLLLREGVFFLSSYQGRIAAVAARNGQVLWSKPFSSYQGLAADTNALFASDADGHLQAFEQASGASLWKQEGLYLRRPSAPAVLGSTVAVGDYQGYVHFLSREDGRFLARYRVDKEGIRASLVSQDEVLYVLGNGGRLVALAIN